MSDELIDLVDDNNEPTGEVMPRSEVHAKRLWHRGAHVWVLNSKNELLLQKRSAKVKNNPNLWDVSVGGHCESGDDIMIAAIRESEEELGIKFTENDLEYLFTVKKVVL